MAHAAADNCYAVVQVPKLSGIMVNALSDRIINFSIPHVAPNIPGEDAEARLLVELANRLPACSNYPRVDAAN